MLVNKGYSAMWLRKLLTCPADDSFAVAAFVTD
jgi:hypothetical protein